MRALAQQPACTIGGTVVDDDSNRPVVKARVMAEVRGRYSLMGLTDERGSFCFERLDPAIYHILVQKTGYIETQYGGALAVEGSSEVKPLAIRMTAYAAISGVVLDADGDPVPGAEVTAWVIRGIGCPTHRRAWKPMAAAPSGLPSWLPAHTI